MSLFVGAKLSCDRESCGWSVAADSEEEVRRRAESDGWSRVDGRRDFCPHHTAERAKRPKLADLLPGYKLMTALDAARAAGFIVGEECEDGSHPITHCGIGAEIGSLLGAPYAAKCPVCGIGIVDAAGPSFGKGSVAFMDSDKVDADDGVTWYVVGTEPHASEAPSGERLP